MSDPPLILRLPPELQTLLHAALVQRSAVSAPSQAEVYPPDPTYEQVRKQLVLELAGMCARKAVEDIEDMVWDWLDTTAC